MCTGGALSKESFGPGGKVTVWPPSACTEGFAALLNAWCYIHEGQCSRPGRSELTEFPSHHNLSVGEAY